MTRKVLCALIATVVLSSCATVTQVDNLNQVPPDIGSFDLTFTILRRDDDPQLALRKSGIVGVDYNVPTWLASDPAKAEFIGRDRSASQGGDGFDDRILTKSPDGRTANAFSAGQNVDLVPQQLVRRGDIITAIFPEHPDFTLSAQVTLSGEFPQLEWQLVAKTGGYYSVAYTGTPDLTDHETDEIWQPLIWNELRTPDRPYLTLAFRTPLPTTLARHGKQVTGVLASPESIPFDPLPLAENSKFGVALRDRQGSVSPSIFAPVMGGAGSYLEAGQITGFRAILVNTQATDITDAYEKLAREVYGFRDYRRNEIASANTVLENIISYSLSDYAQWQAPLRGSSYSTDVPGAVKNVTSLNAISLALAMDDTAMFQDRAIPLVEYMVSREKFLFSLDPEQRIQHPSRALLGPTAPISELTALSQIIRGSSNAFLVLAEQEFDGSRERNLDVKEQGDTWQNALALYRATGEQRYLTQAKQGADAYLRDRVNTQSRDFSDGAFFFWPAFVPDFINLHQLYEITADPRYLAAAQRAARQYSLYTWMAPAIPDETIRVNEGGKAPVYWYLSGKGHTPMYAEEEQVDAWRLSEIGLTPESSGTSSGHRAIFMANYAPWLLRIGHATKDQFLLDIARSAIVGRYRSFPGYHINTARTTVYEKADYPLRKHKELSVNSFHYNHILPMASMLLDWLVSEAYVRSDGEIDFPNQYAEGYAYLQNRIYGHAAGRFYGAAGVRLWMPAKLMTINTPELNTVSAIKDNAAYIAFTNASDVAVSAEVVLNKSLLTLGENAEVSVQSATGDASITANQTLAVNVPAKGITAIRISGATPHTQMPDNALEAPIGEVPYLELTQGDARAFRFDYGALGGRAYIYTRQDDAKLSGMVVDYREDDGHWSTVSDKSYPFEVSIPISNLGRPLQFRLTVIDRSGGRNTSPIETLK